MTGCLIGAKKVVSETFDGMLPMAEMALSMFHECHGLLR